MIWFQKPTLEILTQLSNNTLVSHLGIVFTEIGDDFIMAKMPVDERTVQPMRILHGGASVVLSETLGSVGGTCCIDLSQKAAVGLEINANHIRSVSSGWVYGKATPIHLGKSTHIWSIEIRDEEGKMVCISRITLSIIDKKN